MPLVGEFDFLSIVEGFGFAKVLMDLLLWLLFERSTIMLLLSR